MTDDTGKARWDALAQKLHEARMSGEMIAPLADGDRPSDVAECYYVQDHEIALLDAEPRAWKLGAPAKSAQEAMGLDEPFAGPVLPGMLLPSPAALDVSGYSCTKFEPEVAITLGTDIDTSRPLGLDEARAAIASYHPAIEIINFRSREGASTGALGMITDYGANGALVLGPAVPPGADDYWNMTLDVRINGKSVAQRTPPPAETEPAALLVWFAAHMGQRGYSLRAGDVITTGSQAGLLPYAPGDLVCADFGAAGIAEVQL